MPPAAAPDYPQAAREMTVAVVQNKIVSTAAWSGTLSSAATAGNTLFYFVSAYNPGHTISSSAPLYNGSPVTGAVKIVDGQPAGGNDYGAMWMLPSVPGSSTSCSITVTNGGTNANTGLVVVEVSGLGSTPAVDKNPGASTGTGGGATSASTGAIGFAPEFVFAFLITDTGAAGSGTGWSSGIGVSSNAQLYYQIPASSGGSFTLTSTQSGGTNFVTAAASVYAPAGRPPLVVSQAVKRAAFY